MTIPTNPLQRPVRLLTPDDLGAYRVTTITERLALAALIAVRERAPVLDRKLGVLLIHWLDLGELFTEDDRAALWRSWCSMRLLTVEVLDRESPDRCGWDDCPEPPCRSTVLVFVSEVTDWKAMATMLNTGLVPGAGNPAPGADDTHVIGKDGRRQSRRAATNDEIGKSLGIDKDSRS